MTTSWRQKRTVMRSYDSTARIYDKRYSEEQEAKYKSAIENVQLMGKILDVGCGSGLFFKHVANTAEIVVGVDSSRKLLLESQKHVRSLSSVQLVQADADHLPFSQEIFDVVFAFTMLQNMPKPAETLREFTRVAKLAAQVVVSGLKKIFSAESFRELLEDAGLCSTSIMDSPSLKCYIALSRCQK